MLIKRVTLFRLFFSFIKYLLCLFAFVYEEIRLKLNLIGYEKNIFIYMCISIWKIVQLEL